MTGTEPTESELPVAPDEARQQLATEIHEALVLEKCCTYLDTLIALTGHPRYRRALAAVRGESQGGREEINDKAAVWRIMRAAPGLRAKMLKQEALRRAKPGENIKSVEHRLRRKCRNCAKQRTQLKCPPNDSHR